jgi:hypothetical protein
MRISALLLVTTLTGATSVCAQELFVPDPKLTPGLARTDLALEEICTTKWAATRGTSRQK